MGSMPCARTQSMISPNLGSEKVKVEEETCACEQA